MALRNAFELISTAAKQPALGTAGTPSADVITVQGRTGMTAVKSSDDFQGGEVLADQTGAAAVLTFTFSAAVQLVVVSGNGIATDFARVDPFGGTPSATLGIPCGDEVPTFIPVTATVVRVFAPTGMVITVWGFRRS